MWYEAVLLMHIAWIVANSELTYNNEPLPDVRAYPEEIMLVLRWGQELVDLSKRSEETFLPSPHAIYDHNSNTILLNESKLIPEYVVVHELVHYLQDINGVMDMGCIPRNEDQAYRIQRDWGEAHGVDTDLSGWFDAKSSSLDCEGGLP